MLDLSAFDPVLKDFYGPALVSLINKDVKLLKLFTKDGDVSMAADGRQVVYPVHVSRNTGAGAIGENKTLPAAGNQGYALLKASYRYNYGRLQLTAQTIKASKTNKGAFKQAMTAEMEGIKDDVARQRNRQLFGFGTGILCRVSGNQASGTTITVKDPYGVAGTVNPARLIQVGDYIAFVRNATPANATDSDIVGSSNIVTVSSISSDGTQITFSSATGATLNDNDMLILSPANTSGESSVNKEPMGLLGIVDDGTYLTTLHNISRTTYPQFKSFVLALNGDLTFDALQRGDDAADEKGGGGVTHLVSHHSVRRVYINQTIVNKRFVGDQNMKPDAGWAGAALKMDDVTFNEHPWLSERMCPYGTIFGISAPTNKRFVNCEGEWADDSGSSILFSTTKDIYEARFRIFDQFHNDRPDRCFRIDGVNASVDAVLAE